MKPYHPGQAARRPFLACGRQPLNLVLPGLLALLALAATLSAQVITGTILGRVTDPSGAAIASAEIIVTNLGTSVRSRTQSNSEGEFVLPYLPPGTYDVAIEAPGFRTYVENGVRLTLDAKVRVDAKMTVGNVTETVQVVASVVQLQTDASDVSTQVSKPLIESVPNIGRNPTYYLATVAGVVPRGAFEGVNNFATGEDGRAQFSNFTVNGSRPLASEILLDGAPNTSAAFNEIAVVPNLDAIGEMKVITNAYSAEYGRASGGVVSFSTKSGEQQFHGSLYDYWRNDVLNANDFGRNSFGRDAAGDPVRRKGQFNIHQFGGTFSGPVLVPKLYNGRNRTFFFFAYEGNRRVEDASAFLTVPTELERRGDFSQTRALFRNPATGLLETTPRLIFDPTPGGARVTDLGSGQFRINRTPFPNNVIPATVINRTGQLLASVYPLPNISPLQPDGTQNFFDANVVRTRTDQIIAKLDHNSSPTHRTFFRWTTDWTQNTPPDRFARGNRQATQQSLTTQFNPTVTLGHTWTASPASLFEFRANLNRINLVNAPPGGLNADLAALGFSPAMVAATQNQIFPFVVPGGGFPEMGFRFFQLRDNHSTNYAFTGNYTRIAGRWTFKTGGEWRPLYNNFNQPRVPGMIFRADENWTRECAGAGCPALPPNRVEGFVIADLLVGGLRGGDAGSQFAQNDPRLAFRNAYGAIYSQNDWKVTSRLTINLGVRWDFQAPATERFDRMNNFDRRGRNFTGTPGAFQLVNRGGLSRYQMEPDWRQWQPRVGFAWRAIDKTVIRAGYGISFDATTGIGSGAEGFGTDAFTAPAFSRIRPLSNLDILERPFNDSFNGGGRVLASDVNDPLLTGRNVLVVERGQRTPYAQQWNFTIERELPRNTNFSVAYIGTKGTRLMIQQLPVNNANAIDPAILENARAEFLLTGANPLAALVPNPLFGRIPNFNAAIAGPNITRENASRPFPAYQNVQLLNQRFGSSSYHSLQLNLRRAFQNGFELGGNYTWAKNIDFGNHIGVNGVGNTANGGGGSGFTVNNFALERAVANSDVRHRAVAYYVVDLPFGKGRAWANSTPVLSHLLGGWKVAGVSTFASGLPLAIGGGGFGRPDLVGDPVLPKEYRRFGDGVTPLPLPDGSSIVVPNRRLLYFNPRAFQNRVVTTPRPGVPGQTLVQNDIYWYGTSPRFLDQLRGFGINNTNLTVSRTFAIRERLRMEFRAEAVNAFNRTEFGVGGIDRGFGGTNLDPGRGPLGQSISGTFGTADITSIGRTPRYLQLGLRLVF